MRRYIMVLAKLLGNMKFIFVHRGMFELPFVRNMMTMGRVNLVMPHAVFGWLLMVQARELVAGAYTRPLFSSTCAVSDTQHTLYTP